VNPAALEPISGHAILVLLLQLAGLLALARVLSELMRRLGQPAVIGELLAGIALGPTILGHYLPALSLAVFPQTTRQFHLLEVVSWIGMVLLLLLTGLETDVRIMRSLGRSALFASLGGMIVNFTAGGVLGWLLPAQYLTSPGTRPIFAAFLATALAITALPVVAKILIDLRLIRRNVGVVILSAGVLDDTTGWLVLSVIAGIADAGAFSPRKLTGTLVGLVAYLLLMRFVVFPVFSRLLRYVNERVEIAGSDVTLILVFTFASAAATEAIGVHAVFGAFVMGLLVRQVPRVRQASLHALELFVLSALSPIFFAFVGLKVDLWSLTSWQLPALVITIAVLGKMIGCYAGGRAGGLGNLEATAVGFGMVARGAMGLVVALIGLSLGLLTAEMYSTIVLVAVVTTFLAPLLLRMVLPRLPITVEERRRIDDQGRTGMLPTGPLRVLVPTAGGDNAAAAFAMAAPLVSARGGALTALFVEPTSKGGFWRRLLGGPSRLAGRGIEEHLAHAEARMGPQRRLFSVKRVAAPDTSVAVLAEARRDYDLLMVGASPRHLVESSPLARIVSGAAMPVVIVRGGEPWAQPTGRVLVPLDGSIFSRAAGEFAFAYAASAKLHVTLLHVLSETRVSTGTLASPERRDSHAVGHGLEATIAARIRGDFARLAEDGAVEYDVRLLASGDPSGTILEVTRSEGFDLLVLGAENKLLSRPSFFGPGTAAIVDGAECTTAVVIPSLG
jgi:K+:H+ antiporter